MINYSVEFPIDGKNSVADVVRLACDWVAGSPHTKIKRNSIILAEGVDGELTHDIGGERITAAICKTANYEIGGLRYVRTETHGLEWTTSIVTLKSVEQHFLSLQVACEANNATVSLPPPKKPYFIKQVLTQLGGGDDGEIPVADRPFRLKDGQAQIAAALMLGTAKNRLPIVYVSSGFEGKYYVEPNDLAMLLSGMAHVIVEPSRAFSSELKRITGGGNVFGGAIGVYWPDSGIRKRYHAGSLAKRDRGLQIQIAKDIRVALSNRRLQTNCTWENLKESLSKKRYEILKSRESTELEDYIKAFDDEVSAKEDRLRDANFEIARLNADLRRYAAANFGSGGDGVLKSGVEQELYHNEVMDIVIDALRAYLGNTKQGSRRRHVIEDLLQNNVSSGAAEEMAGKIKALFKSYKDLDAKTRGALSELGFDLSEDGKHCKAVFQGDGRYTFAIPKTSSDHRAGKNLASDINGAIF